MNVLTRAKRILKPIENFKSEFKGNIATYHSDLLIHEDEILIGIYENVPKSLKNAVGISDKSLYVEQNGKWVKIEFSKIKKIQSPDKSSDSKENLGVFVQYNDGKNLLIPVWGGTSRFRDVYEFTRFLMRVNEDTKAV